MNRDYDAERVLEIVKEIKIINPSVFVETRVFYGFPGETRKEFKNNFRLAKYFNKVLYSFFSDRENASSWGLDKKISKPEILYRTWLVCKEFLRNQIIYPGEINGSIKDLFELIRLKIGKEKVDVLLVYPRAEVDKNIMPPLSLLAIAEPLVKSGFGVSILDERLEEDILIKIDSLIDKNKIICVGMTCYTGPQIARVLKIAAHIKSRSAIPIVLGGPHPSILPEETLEDDNIDIVVRGEGEESFVKLVSCLKNKKKLRAVSGVSFKSGGHIVHNQKSKLVDINKFNALPYYLLSEYADKYVSLGIQTSRGCFGFCAYCIVPVLNNRKYRAKTASLIIKQIQEMLLFFGPSNRSVVFLDENFFAYRSRIGTFLRMLKQALVRKRMPFFNWWVECRADDVLSLDPNHIRDLQRVGLSAFYVGAESGSDRILSKISKGITRETVLAANKYLSKLNIFVEYTFMEGFPFETQRDRSKTYSLIRNLRRDNPNCKVWKVNTYTPYPGTRLFKDLPELIKPSCFRDWSSFDFYRRNTLNIKYDNLLR
jgi:radical SAM superfamily enzyme YgiQ (UPF0313 family)